MHNKRGVISGEVVSWIPRIIFLIVVVFAVVLLVKILIITIIDARDTEANVLVNRFLFSKDGLSYYDDKIKRVYPGIIDFKKFESLSSNNPNSLDTEGISYGPDNPLIAAKITLKYVEPGLELTAYYNKDKYDKWSPRVLPTVTGGAGSVKAFTEKKFVLVKEGDKLSPAFLEFDIIS